MMQMVSSRTRESLVGLTLAVIVFLTGCGGSGVRPVSGVVTYQGKPVEGAQVMFTPADGRPAQGTTDANGRYQLTTDKIGDGAKVGTHQVTVQKMERVPGAAADDPYAQMKNVLPAKYAQGGALTVTVENKPQNDIPLSLAD